jgi:Cdc6-like AAA superfamily ATPase
MKNNEIHFEDYMQNIKKENLHPKMTKLIDKLPNNIKKLPNLIIYGPAGIGKYTQALNIIKKYSPSCLKYEKKISILFNKNPFFFKISDIHYEIDMSLLGCNSKLFWNEIFVQILDIINTSSLRTGILLCKNFGYINNELLDNFYSYMQKINDNISVKDNIAGEKSKEMDLKYILITEQISFIPNNILSCCEILNFQRPTKKSYNACIKLKAEQLEQPISIKLNNDLSTITNIKNIYYSQIEQIQQPHIIMCNSILQQIINYNEIKFIKFRNLNYDLFIYSLDINKCIWYILTELIKIDKIKKNHLNKIFLKLYTFFYYYNNNYRPIYHLENLFYYLITLIHTMEYHP